MKSAVQVEANLQEQHIDYFQLLPGKYKSMSYTTFAIVPFDGKYQNL